ncbi:hypothetical protein J3B02_005386 [Coemansia erecta]|uniref:BLOC-1-related complex subunit 7 n=1 Tax=Coemansia asiatica TaxID=1052880 RepID=A0A9W7XQB6_9FUNG|nr:hypothetical protein LPJ64_001250 [Coemansia asiatica]KAJ2843068.1 hypothetical protein J3B02_005386 [Coemansia erecta]KAJ2857576.1 hypothetical protein FB639_005986 [Coemansia asiatica]
MNGIKTTAVEEAQTDIREHTQAIVGELGLLTQEMSGGSEVREMLSKVSRQTAISLDMCIKDTQQSLVNAQSTAARLAAKVEDANERWRSLDKTVDIIKVSSASM